MRTSLIFIASVCACLLSVGAAAEAQPGTAPVAHAQPARAPHRPLNILLTNDDGWRGPGGSSTPLIASLRDALEADGNNVVVVAPATDQSGQGGRFTLPPHQLNVAQPEHDVWTVDPGSPSDSVYFGIDQVFRNGPPDLVVSGMNPGNNMGTAIDHSGTVNAALTATEEGIPSLAISLQSPTTWPAGMTKATPSAAAYVARLVDHLESAAGLHGKLMPADTSLNVNIPVRPGPVNPATGQPGSVLPPRGERVTRVDTAPALTMDYSRVSGGTGAGAYSIGLTPAYGRGASGSDVRAIADGYVSVTPLEADRGVDRSTTHWLQRVLATGATTHRP